MSEIAERLRKLLEKATEGPWAWDQRGEKINEWGIGVACSADDQPLVGRFDDEDAQYVEYVCSHEASTCNYTDPELICLFRNSGAELLDELDRRQRDNELLHAQLHGMQDGALVRDQAILIDRLQRSLLTWKASAESAEKRLGEAVAALKELVACKDLKEKIELLRYELDTDRKEVVSPIHSGEWMALTVEYNRRKPLAWEVARKALGHDHKTSPPDVPPFAHIVVNDQGYIVGAWRRREDADAIVAKGQASHHDRVVPVFEAIGK